MIAPTPLAIERATIQTWPARITENRDGWRLLVAGGVTGRVNAAWPLEWTGRDVESAILDVEAWYASHGMPPRFKLTDGAVAPAHLPDALSRRGYAWSTHTLVMTRPLLDRELAESVERVPLSGEMTPAFDEALRDSTPDPRDFEERRAIAERAPDPAAFAVIQVDDRPAAIGMMALAGDLAGIFLMRTVPAARRTGLGRRVLRSLLGRASKLGAACAFLQVEADNAPAIALYRSEGFASLTSYRYWRKLI